MYVELNLCFAAIAGSREKTNMDIKIFQKISPLTYPDNS